MTYEHLDLFSGIGGFALAAQWAGFRTVGFSEIEPFASRVLAARWPHIPNHGDIRTVTGDKCCADLVTRGFPCQPFSVAGKRRGSADDRALWPEMRRVIATGKPSWVLAENVPGIIGMELDSVLSDLEDIGYEAGAITVPACAVDAPHERERLWIIAHANRVLGQARPRAKLQRRTTSDVESVHFGDTPHNQSRWVEMACAFRRMDDGVSDWAHRTQGLGNAIVPQVAYQILKAVKATLP